MYKFSHIGSFSNLIDYARKYPNIVGEELTYEGLVKLHGSNLSAVINKEKITFQSRNKEISIDDDHYGFCSFASKDSVKHAIFNIALSVRFEYKLGLETPIILYGEYIGPGIQNSVAVNMLPEKQWVIFLAAYVKEGKKFYVKVPSFDNFDGCNVYSIHRCFLKPVFTIRFGDKKSIEEAGSFIEKSTKRVENSCPWALRFGIEGTGEGLVWYPKKDFIDDSQLLFKSKGEQHKVVRSKKYVQVYPEVLEKIDSFINFSLTEARLKQGLSYLYEMNKPILLPSTGEFVKWVINDIKRECFLEIERNDFDWRDVSKIIGKRAAKWFMELEKIDDKRIPCR